MSKLKGVPEKVYDRTFEVWSIVPKSAQSAQRAQKCPKVPRVPKNVTKFPERPKVAKMGHPVDQVNSANLLFEF